MFTGIVEACGEIAAVEKQTADSRLRISAGPIDGAGSRTFSEMYLWGTPHDGDEALPLPIGLARYSVQHEWARSLADVVERRMFLVHAAQLKREWIKRLAEASGAGCDADVNRQVELCEQRLAKYYGRRLEDET